MNVKEYLLVKLAEECVETAQRATKALCFGLDEIQPGQTLTNAARLFQEYTDIVAVMKMLDDDHYIAERGERELCMPMEIMVEFKQEKVAKYMEYSRQRGTLE